MTTPASQTSGALGSGSSYTRKHQAAAQQAVAGSNGMELSYDVSSDSYILKDAKGGIIWQVFAQQLLQQGPPAQIVSNLGTQTYYYSGNSYAQWGTATGGGSGGAGYITGLGGALGVTSSAIMASYNGPTPTNCGTNLKSEGIRAGEIIAWRAWRIKGDHLISAVMNDVWTSRLPMNGDPIKGYGVHAYSSKAGPYVDGYAGPYCMVMGDGWVVGRVALWGEIVEHQHGYRAQYGRVHSLEDWCEHVPQSLREGLIDKYVRKPNG